MLAGFKAIVGNTDFCNNKKMNSLKNYFLRKASELDFEFVRTIHHQTLREYIEPIWGWSEVQQDSHVKRIFSPEKFQIIQYDTSINLESISIVPELQDKGIGSKIIQQIIAEGETRRLSIYLEVLKSNTPAKRLYKRLGCEYCI